MQDLSHQPLPLQSYHLLPSNSTHCPSYFLLFTQRPKCGVKNVNLTMFSLCSNPSLGPHHRLSKSHQAPKAQLCPSFHLLGFCSLPFISPSL